MKASGISTADIREEFIRAQVDGTRITLKELAVRHGRSYAALRKAASDDQWSAKAAMARAERDAAVAEKVAEKNTLTAALIEEAIGREFDVRSRHALLARSLQRMALERLMALQPNDVSPKLAVEMLRVGIEEERIALGIRETGENVCERPTRNMRCQKP